MIYLRIKDNNKGWITFQTTRGVNPLDFHLYDFKIDDDIYTQYSETFQYAINKELTWQRMKAQK